MWLMKQKKKPMTLEKTLPFGSFSGLPVNLEGHFREINLSEGTPDTPDVHAKGIAQTPYLTNPNKFAHPPQSSHDGGLLGFFSLSSSNGGESLNQKLIRQYTQCDGRGGDVEGIREKSNWLINLLYVRQDFAECLQVIEQTLKESAGMNEVTIYTKGLIRRQEGKIRESLQLFKTAAFLHPKHSQNLEQLGVSLYLQGKHLAALEVQEASEKANPEDHDVFHCRGLCHAFLGNQEEARKAFQKANELFRREATYIELGKVLSLQEDNETAIKMYSEAFEFSPESSQLLTTLGILHVQNGHNEQAFENFENALTVDPRNPKALLAAASLLQGQEDLNASLLKYRVLAIQIPNSPQLWNNVGMCFFGKTKFIAAIACLKRAIYLDPFEWIIAYNLGIVSISTGGSKSNGQYVSAFHYFSASLNLNPDFPPIYMGLAITLSRLGDIEKSCAAYAKAIEMDGGNTSLYLNLAITLFKHGKVEESAAQLSKYERLVASFPKEFPEDKHSLQQKEILKLLISGST